MDTRFCLLWEALTPCPSLEVPVTHQEKRCALWVQRWCPHHLLAVETSKKKKKIEGSGFPLIFPPVPSAPHPSGDLPHELSAAPLESGCGRGCGASSHPPLRCLPPSCPGFTAGSRQEKERKVSGGGGVSSPLTRSFTGSLGKDHACLL